MRVNPYQSPAEDWSAGPVTDAWRASDSTETPLLVAEFESDAATLEAAVMVLLMRLPGLLVGRVATIGFCLVALCGLAGLLGWVGQWPVVLLCCAGIVLLIGLVLLMWFLPRVAARMLFTNWRQSPASLGTQHLRVYRDRLRHENEAGCYERRLDCLLGIERLETGLVIIAEPNRAIVCPLEGTYSTGSFEAFAERMAELAPQRL